MKKELRDSPGKIFDPEKPRLELIDPAFLEGLARTLGWGESKYPDDNHWTHGRAWMGIFAALLRHLYCGMYSGPIDPESGKLHLDHAAANLMFLRRYMVDHRFAKFDDRCEVFWGPPQKSGPGMCGCFVCAAERRKE